MRFGSMCSGIEAASVAFEPLGWKAAWFAEIEPFPSAVLAHHYPSVPNLGDMTKVAGHILDGSVEAPDVLCGGTPCQAFSVAGLRNSMADERGGLTLKFVEAANAIDHVRTRRSEDECIVLWENVPGVLSTKDNAFGCFLAALVGESVALEPTGGRWTDAGCVYGPKRAASWRVLDAQYFGLAQRRRRVFVVASARSGFDPGAVLFEFDGVRRDSAPSREAREGVAGCLRSIAGKRGGIQDQSGPEGLVPELAACLTTGTGLRYDTDTDTILPVTHTLRGEGFDASEDGTGRGTPLVPVAYAPDVAGTLVSRSSRGGGQTNSPGHQADQQLVAFDTTQITSAANFSNPRPGDPCHPLAAGAHPPAIAFDCKASGMAGFGVGDIASTMRAMGHKDSHTNGGGQLAALQGARVRRLTPVECERLQGFPDNYTAIPWRKKPASECPDGPRYKALGNSWAVFNVRWIGRRIDVQVSALQEAA